MAKAYKDLRDKVRSNPERAARVKTRRQAMEDALALAEIREKRELTQTDIAQVLEMSQANVSRIERQQNLYLSTLAEYVEALGGELKISAVFADEEVEIGVGRELSGRRYGLPARASRRTWCRCATPKRPVMKTVESIDLFMQ